MVSNANQKETSEALSKWWLAKEQPNGLTKLEKREEGMHITCTETVNIFFRFYTLYKRRDAAAGCILGPLGSSGVLFGTYMLQISSGQNIMPSYKRNMERMRKIKNQK
jgi:hypothetical protein